MYEWLYPDSFNTLTTVANWVAAASVLATLFLLLSWAVLPVDKTARHYLSICLTFAVTIINVGTLANLIGLERKLTADLARLRGTSCR